MNILIFKTKNDYHTNQKLRKKIYDFFKILNGNIYIFDYSNLNLNIIRLCIRKPRYIFYIFFKIFLCAPLYLFNETNKIYFSQKKYYQYIRVCLHDAIERITGDIRSKESTKLLKKDYPINYFLRAIKIVYTIELIKAFKKIFKIDTFFLGQLDGYPMTAICSFCLLYKKFVGSYAFDGKKVWIMIRREKICESLALKSDLKKLSNISNKDLDNAIEKAKIKYISPKKKKLFPDHFYKKDKKVGVVLLHVFTDQARIRLGNSWQENYLDWFLETINICKLNKNVRWIFKAHPFERFYPIKKEHNQLILEMISKNGFEYIPADKNIKHGEIAEIASFIVTCTGTAKFEYSALFNLPVISCIGEYLLYDPSQLSFTAKSFREYKDLIMNAHNIKLNYADIRKARELFAFFYLYSGSKLNSKTKITSHDYSENSFLYRNY